MYFSKRISPSAHKIKILSTGEQFQLQQQQANKQAPSNTMYLLRHNPAFYHGRFDTGASPTVLLSRQNCFAPGKEDNQDNSNQDNSKMVYRTIDANASESDDQFTLTMDLPGVKSDQLTVQVEGGGVLCISADRPPTANGTIVAYRQRFAVDEDTVDAAKLEATLEDGVLTLTLPKMEAAKPIEVAVVEGEAAASTAEDLRITFDVPGIKAADLKVVVHNGLVTITGERKKGNTFARVQRTMMLDRHRTDLTQPRAYLAHGVLTFTAPHKEPEVAKTIQLDAAAAQQPPQQQNVLVESAQKQNVLVENVPEEEATAKM
jgi:HSP20 family protein